MFKLTGSIELTVVDHEGKPALNKTTGKIETRRIVAPAWLVFGQDKPLPRVWDFEKVPDDMLDWKYFFGEKVSDGQSGRIDMGWGSSLKDKRAFWLPKGHDPMVDMGWTSMRPIDGLRMSRALFNHALYGAAFGKVKVALRKNGTRVGNEHHYVADGHGIISETLWSQVRNDHQRGIVLADLADSTQPCQWFTWGENKEFITQRVEERLKRMEEDDYEFKRLALAEEADKQRLLGINPAMSEHPFLQQALTRHAKALAGRLASTFPMKAIYRTAIPGPVTAISGLNGIGRFPNQSWNHTQVVDNRDKDVSEIAAWVDLQTTAQYTLTAKEGTFKGDVTRAPDAFMGGYDIILSIDDPKVYELGAIKLDSKGKPIEQDLEIEAYLGFNQVWDPGSLCMVSDDVLASLRADTDGDGVFVFEIDQRMADYMRSRPKADGAKLKKLSEPLTPESRAKMMAKGVKGTKLVGMGSNLEMTYTAMVESLGDRKAAAKLFGYNDPDKLEHDLDLLIQFGTDIFKADADVDAMLDLYDRILKAWGKANVGYTKWKNSELAITTVFPRPYDEGDKDANAWDIANHFVGTSAQIFRLTHERVAKLVKKHGSPVVRSPKEFAHWVQDVPMVEYINMARSFAGDWGVYARGLNFKDAESIDALKGAALVARQSFMAKSKLDAKTAANAMWLAVHDKTSVAMATAAVFWMFPAEAEEIVRNGARIEEAIAERKSNPNLIVLNGLNKAVANPKELYRDIPVKVQRVTFHTAGNEMVRYAIVAQAWTDGKITVTSGVLPPNTLGLVAMDKTAPEEGEYIATLKRLENKSYSVELM